MRLCLSSSIECSGLVPCDACAGQLATMVLAPALEAGHGAMKASVEAFLALPDKGEGLAWPDAQRASTLAFSRAWMVGFADLRERATEALGAREISRSHSSSGEDATATAGGTPVRIRHETPAPTEAPQALEPADASALAAGDGPPVGASTLAVGDASPIGSQQLTLVPDEPNAPTNGHANGHTNGHATKPRRARATSKASKKSAATKTTKEEVKTHE